MKFTTPVRALGVALLTIGVLSAAVAAPNIQSTDPLTLTPANTENTLLGTNCNSSPPCSTCTASILTLLSSPAFKDIPYTTTFREGQHVVCEDCNTPVPSKLCVYTQNFMGKKVSVEVVRSALEGLVEFRCKVCGSAALRYGDVLKGEVSVGVVGGGCGGGEC